jgi:hypothetical protein
LMRVVVLRSVVQPNVVNIHYRPVVPAANPHRLGPRVSS